MNARIPTPSRLATALAMALLLIACNKTDEVAETEAPVAEPPTAPPPTPTLAIKPAEGAVDATDEAVAATKDQIKAAAAASREKWRGKTFEEFEATVYKEPGEDGKYIIDGDIAIPDRKLLQEYFKDIQNGLNGTAGGKLIVNQIGGERPPGMPTAIAVNLVNGRPDIWNSAGKKQLKYCVSTTFGARHASVVADMAAATQPWEEAANVDFLYVPAENGNCKASNQNVVFDVRPVDVGGEYLARAFFPNDQRAARNVLIDESSFQLAPDEELTLVGILRHELGHALGWRHEHTRPESGTCFEDSQFQPLTSYDRFSVMHYPHCNGGGDWSLQLTGSDKAGAACIYGKGSNNTENLSQCLFQMPDVATGSVATENFPTETLALSQMKQYGPFDVKPGSLVEVHMSGAGSSAGDPDLYVDFSRPPELSRWICRPFLSHANEICDLQLPLNRRKVYVMVRGYTAANYQLSIKYVRP